MNKRQWKKQRYRWKTGTAKERKRNRELCHRYPFLIPRNVWTGKICWDKPYSYTVAEYFPRGWWKAFGIQMCEELRDALIKTGNLYTFRFDQIKEKYGELRAYNHGGNEVADRVINDYMHISRNVCITCGKPDVPVVMESWIMPECESCWMKGGERRKKYIKTDYFNHETYLRLTKDQDGIIPSSYDVLCFRNGNSEKVTYDVTDKVERIRKRYYERNGR